MLKEELARLINAREPGHEITSEEASMARRSRLVAVFGQDEDRCILRGAIDDVLETGPGGIIFKLLNGRVMPPWVLPDDVISLKRYGLLHAAMQLCEGAYRVDLHFAQQNDDNPDSEACWEIRTTAPHAPFMIYDDGQKFCRGAVFDLDELE